MNDQDDYTQDDMQMYEQEHLREDARIDAQEEDDSDGSVRIYIPFIPAYDEDDFEDEEDWEDEYEDDDYSRHEDYDPCADFEDCDDEDQYEDFIDPDDDYDGDY